jgi:hypothetical protein
VAGIRAAGFAGCDKPVSVALSHQPFISRSAGSAIIRFDCSNAGKSGEVRLRFSL